MTSTLIFLTDDVYFKAMCERLAKAGVDTTNLHAPDLEALENHIEATDGTARLVAFATPHVIPKSLLDRLKGPAYNFHPGPPKYPGAFPSVWALYNRDTEYAVTCHEIWPKVDSGPIVGLAEFPLEAGMHRFDLDQTTVIVIMDLFEHLAHAIADTRTPLPKMPVQWWLRTYTRKDFANLCQISPDISEEDFNHVLKAVGEGPGHALTIPLHGRKFELKYEGDEAV